MSLSWPGIPLEELDEVSRQREVWALLLRLLPPWPGSGRAVEDGCSLQCC